MMIVWALVYQLTVGTVCYSLVAELSTRRLQIKTVVLGRNAYNIVGIANSVLTPYMLNPSAWNWGNYAGFFWAGICFCCIVYTYFRLPEPRGRTFAELDLLFERGLVRGSSRRQRWMFLRRVLMGVVRRLMGRVGLLRKCDRWS